MIPAGIIAALSSLADGNMPERWSCTRGGGRKFEDSTGEWSDVPPDVVYNDRGRLDDRSTIGSRASTQGELTVISSVLLSLPVTKSAALVVGDVLECIEATDPAHVGVRVRITDRHLQTQSTERRFPVEVESWPTT